MKPQIEDLVSALEKIRSIADAALTGKNVKTSNKGPSPQKVAVHSSLPSHLIQLRDKGFFKQPKTYNEAHGELNLTYPCEPERVKVALLRLQQAKHLRKASKVVNDRKRTAYVW